MNEKELKELFEMLEKQGMKPMMCDTEIPLFDGKVPCGCPSMCFDDVKEFVTMPSALLSYNPEMFVTLRGESMIEAGVTSEDKALVELGAYVNDGDMVLAYIDGEVTLKTYCEDEDGKHWLVPRNKNYSPILLESQKNVRLLGRVKELLRAAPRTSYRDCISIINRAKTQERGPRVPTPEEVSRAIREIAPKIKIARHWYAVCRVLVDKKVIGENGYGTFINMVNDVVPSHEHLPSEIELQRYDLRSVFAFCCACRRSNPLPFFNVAIFPDGKVIFFVIIYFSFL